MFVSGGGLSEKVWGVGAGTFNGAMSETNEFQYLYREVELSSIKYAISMKEFQPPWIMHSNAS